MDASRLTLRQRKLLSYMQNHSGIVLGSQLADYLSVSVRTIRSDIQLLNQTLADLGIEIKSFKSKGYMLNVADPDKLRTLTRTTAAFDTREGRVRYLALTLALAESPVDIYELEDEMYISHTTLKHDLHRLRARYVLMPPGIILHEHSNQLSFEENEEKRRSVLVSIFHDTWNYASSQNAYDTYDFLDGGLLEQVMEVTDQALPIHRILMEDTDRVSLNLAITIMCQRCMDGHMLIGGEEAPARADDTAFAGTLKTPDAIDPEVLEAVEDIFSQLRRLTGFDYSGTEEARIALQLDSMRMLNADTLSFTTIKQRFSTEAIRLADSYLDLIASEYNINLKNDEDFYITLLQYIRYLRQPYHTFNRYQIAPDVSRRDMGIAFELASRIQILIRPYLNGYLNIWELIYLALMLRGALEYRMHLTQKPFNAAICCHLNIYAAWALKRSIMTEYSNRIFIKALMPVQARKDYDFSDTDIVLSTIHKPMDVPEHTRVLYVSPFMTGADHQALDRTISELQIDALCADASCRIRDLLDQAIWHECVSVSDRFDILNTLASDFVETGIAGEEYRTTLLRRESTECFAIQPGIILVHAAVSAAKSALSIMTLNHRITWNSYKIRTIIAAALTPNDRTFIFRLISLVNSISQMDGIGHAKTREAVEAYFKEIPLSRA